MPDIRRSVNPAVEDRYRFRASNKFYVCNIESIGIQMTTNGIGPDNVAQDPRDRFREAGDISERGMTYNPSTDTYTATFDDTPASVAITRGLADIQNCDVTDLDPLYESVDPDALDSLVASASEGFSVALTVDGCDVVVRGNRLLEIGVPADR